MSGLQRGSARILALQPLVPSHDIITEEHTEDVSNTTVVGYTGLQVATQNYETSVHLLSPLTGRHIRLSKHASFVGAVREIEGDLWAYTVHLYP